MSDEKSGVCKECGGCKRCQEGVDVSKKEIQFDCYRDFIKKGKDFVKKYDLNFECPFIKTDNCPLKKSEIYLKECKNNLSRCKEEKKGVDPDQSILAMEIYYELLIKSKLAENHTIQILYSSGTYTGSKNKEQEVLNKLNALAGEGNVICKGKGYCNLIGSLNDDLDRNEKNNNPIPESGNRHIFAFMYNGKRCALEVDTLLGSSYLSEGPHGEARPINDNDSDSSYFFHSIGNLGLVPVGTGKRYEKNDGIFYKIDEGLYDYPSGFQCADELKQLLLYKTDEYDFSSINSCLKKIIDKSIRKIKKEEKVYQFNNDFIELFIETCTGSCNSYGRYWKKIFEYINAQRVLEDAGKNEYSLPLSPIELAMKYVIDKRSEQIYKTLTGE